MSSVGSVISQRLTRSYVMTQNYNDHSGCYFYSQADIDAWYAANASKIQKLGSVYIIPGTGNGSNFDDVVSGNNGATQLNHTLVNIIERKTLKDMGKEVIIGTPYEARLLVLRRIEKPVPSSVVGPATRDDFGYVVVENNAADLKNDIGRFTVRVARI